MLDYLRVAKLEYAVAKDKKKTIHALNQILEFASRVPQFTLLKLVSSDLLSRIGIRLTRLNFNGEGLESGYTLF